jgi:thiamine-monophosphate kinase
VPLTTPSSAASAGAPATVGGFGERELIGRITARLPPPPPWLVVGVGDDAAVVEPERNRLDVMTVDAIVEGIHFDRRFTPPGAIGHRALAVNASDLAAMGAAPRLALLSMVLPPALPIDDFDGVVEGFVAAATQYGLHVIGGNLARSPGALILDVTVTGTAKRRQVMTRAGARPGDEVWVSGAVGSANAGLRALRADEAASAGTCAARFLHPEPRVRLGTLLARNRAASACMDLSDGLAEGVRQLGEASGVGIAIDGASIPIEPDAHAWFTAQGQDVLTEAIAGGDDYELLFTVRPRLKGRLEQALRHGGVPLTRIGVCTTEHAFVVRDAGGGESPLPQGFRHFR